MDRDFSQVERDLLKRSHQIKGVFRWVFGWKSTMNVLNSLKNAIISSVHGYRQSLIATIAWFKDTKTQLERRFLHFGNYTNTSNNNNVERSFVWREIDVAFENRILTGAVINVDYIEPRWFLEDISSVVLERVQNTIEKHNCIKMIFNGEFDKYANKS